MKRIVGIVLIIVGAVAFGASIYIDKQVSEGRMQIAQGERQVKQVETVTAFTPETKILGKAVTSSGRSQIAQGRQDIAWYDNLSGWLKVGGGALVVLGLLAVIFLKRA